MKPRPYYCLPKALLFVLCTTMVFHLQAQLKVKKGVIYNGDDAIGKVEGKVGMMRATELRFFSMEGTPILSVAERTYSLNNPQYKDYLWWNIKFEDSGKEMKIQSLSRCANEKCVLQKLEKEAGIEFKGKPIESQDMIAGKYDYSKTLEADTLAKRNEERVLSEKLTGSVIGRNKKSELLLTRIGGSLSEGSETFVLKQDNQVIGKLVKEIIKDPPYSDKVEYKVFKRLSDSAKELLAAEASIKVGPIEAFTYVDKKQHSFTPPPNASMTDRALVVYLIENGYL